MKTINRDMPELAYLLTEVENKYGRRIATTTDFESLSVVIEHQTGEMVSSSTLKRLWGYVSLNPTPRIATLDVLSRYLGFKDFKFFCENLKETKAYDSTFFTAQCLIVADLEAGTMVTIGWAPNRLVTLNYMGEFKFEVLTADNSQLKPGDKFEMTEIIAGYPLYISRVLRDGEYTTPFVAGRHGGINVLKTEFKGVAKRLR